MKICLVVHKYGVRLDDPCCYPLGFMYVSAMLKSQGHTVKVLNYNLWDDDLAFEVADQDVVMFTGFEEFLPQIIRDAAICDDLGIKTILGGALATFKPQEMLQYVDAVVVGEGEMALAAALSHMGIIHGTKPNLDALPLPDYDGFGIHEYHHRHAVRYMGILTSRGCPYSCKFCAHTCAFQRRDLGRVFEEIDLYKRKYGISTLVFNDNTLNVSKSRFMAICDGMKGRRLKWSAAIRADVFDEEMAAAFKSSGGEYFVVGVESFIQSKLDEMGKRVKTEQITRTLDLLHTHGINYHGNILMGFPGETVDIIAEELETMPQWYNVFPMMVQPFIGTEYQQRTLSGDEFTALDASFREYATNRGMNCYSGVS